MTKEMAAYEDTLKDIEKTLGAVPSLMKFFPKERLVHDWPSWKNLGEIDLESVAMFCIRCREDTSWKNLGEIDIERARFLLSADEMVEEMLSENQGNIVLKPTKPHDVAASGQEESA